MEKKTTGWQKTRKFINDIHLWMGLASGLVLIAVCLSGTIYVYNTELQEMAAPHLHRISDQESNQMEKLANAELIEIVKKESGGDITGLTIPHDPQRTYQINVRKADENSRFGTTYYINPYTGNITGTSLEKSKMADFMHDMFSLHRWLLLDRIENPIFEGLENRKLGSYITGTATILFTLGALTGLIIWFPQKMRGWKQGLKIKWKGSWKRTNHDLHNTLGFYSFILLFLMGVTGPQWSFEWYRDGLRKVLGTYEANAMRGGPGPGAGTGKGRNESRASKGSGKSEEEIAGKHGGGRREREGKEKEETINLLPIEHYLAEANAALSYAGDYRISIPKSSKESVNISKTKVGFFAPAASDQIKLSIQNAKIEEVSLFTDKPLNERITSSIKAIHVGNVYGSFTKLLYFIACLIATSLPITGTLIWLNKMKKKPSKKAQHNKRTIRTKQIVPSAG